MFQVPRRTVALALFALQLVPASLYAARTPTAIRFVLTPTRMAPVPVGSLSGRVVDKESGQPIVAAQVTVVGTSLGALGRSPCAPHALATSRGTKSQS